MVLLACCLLAVSSLPSLAVGPEAVPRRTPAALAEGGSPQVPREDGPAGSAEVPPPKSMSAQQPAPPPDAAPAEQPAPPPDRAPAPQPTSAPAPQPAGEPVPTLDPPPGDDETWIEVSVGEQRVRLRRGSRIIRDMPASTGRPATPTPLGTFRVLGRGEWFYNRKYGAGGLWWVSFVPSGEYLFHSTPTDDRRRLLPEGAALLGQPASRGCVRLSVEDARWLYDNVPAGTRVLIHAATGPLAAAFAARTGT